MGALSLLEVLFTLALFAMLTAAAHFRIRHLKAQIEALEELSDALNRRLEERETELYLVEAERDNFQLQLFRIKDTRKDD